MTARVVRACWGLALLVAPGALLRAVERGERPVPPAALVAMRVLGVRHLAQTLADVAGPWPTVGYLGAGTDGLHALTDLGLAVLAPRWRRAALVDTAIAAAFTASTIRSLIRFRRGDAHVAT
jgi:hypothetical protein